MIFLFVIGQSVFANMIDISIAPHLKDKQFIGIKILDEKELTYEKVKGIDFVGLSDMAYHSKTGFLHLISDKGALFTFEASFGEKIEVFKPLKASLLKDQKGRVLRHWKRDAEGLVLDEKGRLLISFEGKAKIAYFHKNSAHYGRLIRKYTLPKLLRETKNYRSKNKSLEALAFHPQYGVLTATEWAVKKDHKKLQTIYALSGKRWQFKAEPEARSAVVAMEVMDDGNMLVMERSYIGLLEPFVITLKKVYLNECQSGRCYTKQLAKMNSHKGWSIDNFEGLTRVGKNRYLIISDDNQNFFQKTLLLYFEVL